MGFSPYSVQMVSTTHCSLKAVSLKMASTVGTVGGTHIPRTGEGMRRLQMPWASSLVNWQSRPLNYLLQHYGIQNTYSKCPIA